jgi:hypothetical protein
MTDDPKTILDASSEAVLRPLSNDRDRPISVTHIGRRERPFPDRRADIASAEIVVRRSIQRDCRLSHT